MLNFLSQLIIAHRPAIRAALWFAWGAFAGASVMLAWWMI